MRSSSATATVVGGPSSATSEAVWFRRPVVGRRPGWLEPDPEHEPPTIAPTAQMRSRMDSSSCSPERVATEVRAPRALRRSLGLWQVRVADQRPRRPSPASDDVGHGDLHMSLGGRDHGYGVGNLPKKARMTRSGELSPKRSCCSRRKRISSLGSTNVSGLA